MLLTQQALGRSARGIVIDRDPRLLQRERNVVFRHAEHRYVGERLVFDQEVAQGVDGILVPKLRDLGQRLTLQRQQLRILHNTDKDGFLPGNFLPFVVPLG